MDEPPNHEVSGPGPKTCRMSNSKSFVEKLGDGLFEAKVSWLDVKPHKTLQAHGNLVARQKEASVEEAEGFVPPGIRQPVMALLQAVACVEQQVLTTVPVDPRRALLSSRTSRQQQLES